ncbi:hypothetical protein [Candidatus Reidiella endopervernicosa]|uniref:Ig-like domain repeat protein n=1 Tax=Candidatus Reidiella endopervernicosa TaxID=2738883 RepID=A0A6N0HWW9_9GAMM|nr:hypothetical protein [Candidatus Reidiella endopervernicosa]QKQ26854.1 hypothetical protein HUE57_11620 [Candidatus Reidiella endopervernicosa]
MGSLTAVLVDSIVPTISNVTIPNSAMKVGDAVTVSISAGEAGLSLNSGTINGVAVSAFSDLTGGNYSATYTVAEGHTDRAVGDTIPVSFVLDDAAGNSSATYSTGIVQNADSIDANSPTISGVTVPNSAMKVGDAVTVSISAGEAGLSPNSGTINGIAVSGFSDLTGGNYSPPTPWPRVIPAVRSVTPSPSASCWMMRPVTAAPPTAPVLCRMRTASMPTARPSAASPFPTAR